MQVETAILFIVMQQGMSLWGRMFTFVKHIDTSLCNAVTTLRRRWYLLAILKPGVIDRTPSWNYLQYDSHYF